MKKTISISLASTPFIIEEDAYQTLDRYLLGIKMHFSGNPDQSEVVGDIEARIAEQFLESGKSVISSLEVDIVITSMGGVDEIGASEKRGKDSAKETSKDTEKHEQKIKHLYRNPDDKVVAGVASGLAAYFGVDVVWVRLAFALFIFLDGFGLLIYLILWLAMPEAKTASQRLEMSGTPVTVETLTERLKERVEEVKKDKGFFERVFITPFKGIIKILSFFFKKILPFVAGVIGFIISFLATIGLLALTTAFILILIPAGREYIDIPMQAVLSPGLFGVAAVSGYFALAIPILFVIFIANRIMKRGRTVNGPAFFIFLGMWLLSLMTVAVSGFIVIAKNAEYMSASPLYREETRNVENLAPFTIISATNGLHVTYTEGASSTVTVTGPAKYIDDVIVVSKNGTLELRPQKKEKLLFCFFCQTNIPSVMVTAPGVTSFMGENGVTYEATLTGTSTKTEISLSNAAHGIFSVNTGDLTAKAENGVYLEIRGTASHTTLTAKNAVNIDASELTATSASINAENGSSAEIGKTETLDAKAHNASSVRYENTKILTANPTNGSTITKN